MRRLRVFQVLVQPVLVWDDGDTLEPAGQVNPITVPLAKLAEMPVQIAAEVSRKTGSRSRAARG